MCGIWAYIGDSTEIEHELYRCFRNIRHRGPDRSDFISFSSFVDFIIGFHRLAIMDNTVNGDQPFKYIDGDRVVYTICNGEIYNYKELIEKYNLETKTVCDCEVIPLLNKQLGFTGMVKELEGEFAIAVFELNEKTKELDIFLARDHMGVRPMYISFNSEFLCISSELKGLYQPGWHTEVEDESGYGTVVEVEPRKIYKIRMIEKVPGSVEMLMDTEEYTDILDTRPFHRILREDGLESVYDIIYDAFEKSVESMIHSDRPLCAALSGGLDSSLVVAMAADILKRQGKTLKTFSLGMPGGTDEKYARMVAEYVGTDHTHILVDPEDFKRTVKENTVYTTETMDITTNRASTGQYLLAKYISENTEYKVVLIGDGSDELTGGYMYFHNAPSPEEYQAEIKRLLSEIHLYDVRRADRCISMFGLEARAPFLHQAFVRAYLSIDPFFRMPSWNGQEKGLLRMAFKDTKLLPDQVLFRPKEAFSDGVSSKEDSWHDMVKKDIRAFLGVDDDELVRACNKWKHCPPHDHESLHYRREFDRIFGSQAAKIIPRFWMPRWSGNTKDPSARVLGVYEKKVATSSE